MKRVKHSKIIIGTGTLFLAVIVFLLVLFHLPDKNSYMDRVNKSNDTSLASMYIAAGTFDELIDLSDLIIEGRVIDYEPHIHDGLVYTKESVKVKKVIKGNVSQGDKITVVFTGGEWHGMTTAPIQDCPVMDMRGNYMLFLNTNDGSNYMVVGGNNGFGLIKDNRIEATQRGELGDYFRSCKVDEMEKNIKDIINKEIIN